MATQALLRFAQKACFWSSPKTRCGELHTMADASLNLAECAKFCLLLEFGKTRGAKLHTMRRRLNFAKEAKWPAFGVWQNKRRQTPHFGDAGFILQKRQNGLLLEFGKTRSAKLRAKIDYNRSIIPNKNRVFRLTD